MLHLPWPLNALWGRFAVATMLTTLFVVERFADVEWGGDGVFDDNEMEAAA